MPEVSTAPGAALAEVTHALTIWQPWASLIMSGCKPYEFRRWPAPRSLVGKSIAIHAAARAFKPEEVRQIAGAPEGTCFDGDLNGARSLTLRVIAGSESLPRGVILGTVLLGAPKRPLDLACAIEDSESIDPDVWAWPMLRPKPFAVAIPERGRQGFWRWSCSWCEQSGGGRVMRLTVISLGAGVQSTAMTVMAADGELSPKPDRAIFADTGGEQIKANIEVAYNEHRHIPFLPAPKTGGE
jgi:hypothetical protein